MTEEKKTINMSPIRDKNETYEEYKIRLRAINKGLKNYLRGKYIWRTPDGTHRKEEK